MTSSHGPPSQPYSARPATNAAAPSSLSQPRTVAPATATWSIVSDRRRRCHLDRSDLCGRPTMRSGLMATLYSLDG